MSTRTHHVILRSRIEVTLDQHSQNNILQRTLHKVVHRHIMPMLSKLFSQYVPDDAIIHLDKLVIDVGDLNLSALGKQLPYQVEQILTLKLKEEIGKVLHNPTADQIIPLPDAKMEAIAHYLSEGNFAWWMVERSEKQIEKTYLELLHHTPLRIAQLWSNLRKKGKAVQRCMALFSQTTVAHTIAYLLKQPIPYFTPILAEAGLLLYQTGILTSRPYTLEQQLHAMALLAIINQQKYQVDRICFLQMLLQQAAIQTATSYEKILEKIHAYYEQNEKKSSYNATIKGWVFQLRDMVATPPKYWYQDANNQQKVLKELDRIGNHTMASYQLSAAVGTIKAVIDQPGIRSLVKSWLKEKKNREQLIKRLPDALFIGFLGSIDPYIATLYADFRGIATATAATAAPICAVKANSLAYCGFEHAKAVYLKAIQSVFKKYISNNFINKQRLSIWCATHTHHPEVAAIMEPLVSITQPSILSDDPKITMYSDSTTTNPQLASTHPVDLNSPPISISEDDSSNLLKALERIIHPTIAADERLRAISDIKIVIDQPGIRSFLQSWLKEKKNREQLIKRLPDALFIKFLQSIDPYIATLYADFRGIATATAATATPIRAVKGNSLAYCGFEHAKTAYLKAIQSVFKKYISNNFINKQRLSIWCATHTHHPEVAAIMEPLVSITQPSILSDDLKITMYSDSTATNPQLASTHPVDFSSAPISISEDDSSNLLKALERIIHPTIAADERLRAISDIKIVIDQPGIRSFLQSWLKEKKNREQLIKRLPDALFIKFLQSIGPYIATLYADFRGIATATAATATPIRAVKGNSLAYCGFEHAKTAYLKAIQSVFKKYISNGLINKQRLSILYATQSYDPAVGAIIRPFVSISGGSLLSDGPKTTEHQNNSLHTDPKLADIGAAYLDIDPVSGLESNLSDVVAFLLYNELPKDQLVAAYVIAKRLGHATCQQIRDQLTPLCQEATILRKLIQNSTEPTLKKLLQAFVPFSDQLLDRLEKVISQSKVVECTEQLTNIRLIKEIFIKAAIIHIPPTTEKQYIERILCHLGIQTSCSPTILCDQLINGAKQTSDHHLVETFSLLKKNLAPLNLHKIDEVDLMFLFTHETFSLDQTLLPLYYSKLLPAIKHRVRASDGADVSQSVINELVAQHLSTIDKPLQATIGTTFYKQITNSLQGKQQRVAKRWNLFLHTGQLEHYTEVTALLNDVIKHLPTFSLAQDKIHVRRRLIANFTPSQLMLLVQNHNDIGKRLANFIQGSYQLWCATEGSLGQQNITRSLFWDSILKTLPGTLMAKEDWLAEIISQWSNVLHITPTTLLETFQIFIQDTKGIPEVEKLTSSLHKLEEKYRERIQQQAIQRGYKAPILTKLYLFLNGSLSFFSQQYPLAMATLSDELMQSITDQPLALSKLLKEQDNHELAARRMVYYFSEEIITKMIACLAKEKSLFVMHYLDVLSNALPSTIIPLDHLSRWKKELCISIIHYLITKSQIEAMEFVQRTLLTICYPKETVYQVIASIAANESTIPPPKNKIIDLLKPLIKQINENRIGPSTVVHTPLEQLPATLEKKIAKRDSVPTEEVRVYTKNTGLVFLWPFFYDFFKVHNLMVGNQFVCEQAAHNAVYLLQYLVTGKLNSPEWQLTLPKLLCGLAYDTVLLPYSHANDDAYGHPQAEMVDQLEKQPLQGATKKIATNSLIAADALEPISIHTGLLIEKVIKRWESLKKLKDTILYQDVTLENILNQHFLNRMGILTREQVDNSSESRFWHLSIMHQDYDTVELLPPWSMTRLKLPWMQEAIVLFWMVE
ncbi:contractile injection system tape measure protein [Candidatus Cardinium hertigii]|uniref:contractile injection system tape measure protein n=1 Tax=Candidatus Cardinium hertigii TaxID=247481 RepID=UPI003D7E6296